jgi:hypothetical protein
MAVLDDVKVITGSLEDALIQIYINRGKTGIRKYLNLKDEDVTDIEITYTDALTEYVVEQYRMRGNEAYKQYSKGSNSGTYSTGISQNVKDLLPLPYISLIG